MFDSLIGKIDAYQRKIPALSFAYALYKKSSEDRQSSLAALFAYYSLFAVFPLLLVLVGVLGIVLARDPSLQHRILNSALANFPIIGSQIRQNVASLNKGGVSIGIGTITILLGARGLANVASRSMNDLWLVPGKDRPGFPKLILRSLAWTAIVGIGFTGSTALLGLYGSFGVFIYVGSLALNIGTFCLASRMVIAPSIPFARFRLGSIIAACLWQILQLSGALIVAHQLRHASAVYGFFGIVIGLLAWMYLQAYLTMASMQIDVVRHYHLWPRSFSGKEKLSGDLASEALRIDELEGRA